MAVFSSRRFASAVALSSVFALSDATTYLSPQQDILLPASDSATNPLEWLGANGPYYAGPNVNGVENTVPDNCYVDQVAYVVRHGSRYPDSGAYASWVALYQKIQAAQYTASGELSFLPTWKPVLTNPTAQISQENPTGFKEAFDLGYRLRTKYPDLYAYGTPFISWANLYPRVVQTAQNFVRGFLGSTASSLGTVVTVNSTGSPEALFDSLSPSDLCPNFVDGNGGTEATIWDSIYLPPITTRLNALLTGNLNFTANDVSLFPYLCGFESHILGTLSPWCGTFSDDELLNYEYRQDLRYYFGTGPGVDLPSKMMLPFLNSLVGLLAQGPGINGTDANGGTFTLPDIITAFLNDGQITELGAATGVWDNQTALSGTAIPSDWKYISSRFVSMRGTVAFERLNCAVASSSSPTTLSTQTPTSTSCSLSSTSISLDCHHDNCYRQFIQSTALVSAFCNNYTTAISTETTGLPTFVSQCSSVPTALSSACSCVVPAAVSPSGCAASSYSTSTPTSTSTSATATPTSGSGNQTYIRILLNDAVYPVPSCQDGPGNSCLLSSYVDFVGARIKAAGNLHDRCNVTNTASPTSVKGASFFTNLADSWLATVTP